MKIQDFNPSSSKYEDLKSLDEAEALVTSYPNSSKAWLMYMVFCLKQAEVNKARSVARQGLRLINFRDDDEKLNLWKALLNLENTYGTKDSVDKLLKEALMYNDQDKIYYHIVDAYISTGKEDGVQKLAPIMFKKFKHDKDMWIKFASYYMQSGKLKDSRDVISRSLQTLPNKEHADILGKAAHLEYKYGDIERSLTIYEDILMKYPKRKDLKSVYIHILKDVGQHERAETLSSCV